MAVRRSNRITSVIGSMERRIKSLEASGAAFLPAGAIIPEDDPDSEPLNLVKTIPTDTYKKIIGARVYGPGATGNFGTRVELYFEENEDDLGVIEAEDEQDNQTLQQIQVYGVNGYSGTSIALSSGKVFKPIEVAYDDPTWAENGLRDDANQTDWRQTPPVSAISSKTVGSTIWYNPVIQDPDKTDKNGKDLVVTRAVDSATAVGANVTVTLNASSHLFQVGDVISVDIPSPFIGLDYYSNGEPDGLFEITAVTSNTISYVLDEPVSSPTTYEYDGTTRHYVYAVARPYVPDGTIWIDENVEPNRVWVWKKLRWYDTAEPIGDVSATQDGIVPNPVTDLTAVSSVPSGSNTPVIDLTWTPPTTRSNGAPISGFLDGYDIWYKKSFEPTWKRLPLIKDGGEGVSSYQIKEADLQQNFTYNIRVYVVDIMSQVSTAASVNVLTATYSEILNPPSALSLSSKLGTITATWDGEDSTGNLPPLNTLYLEIHRSTTNGFTPSDTTIVSTIPVYIGGGYDVFADLEYNTTYYFRSILVRQISPFELEKSDPSAQVSAQVTPLVDTDLLVGNVLNSWAFNGNLISAGALASGAINASNIFGPNVVVQSAIAANAIGADQIAAGSIIAGKIGANAITSNTIAANAITAGKIEANAITADKIEVGALSAKIISGDVIKTANTGTRVELSNTGIYAYNGTTPVFSFNTNTSSLTIGGYATTDTTNSLSSSLDGKVNTGGGAAADVNAYRNVTTINGDAITTGTITANLITATDTFKYKNDLNTYEVQIGQAAIPSNYGNSAGVNFLNSGTNVGYIGSYGGNSTFELGKDFFNSYLSFGLNGGNRLTANFTNGYYFGGTTFELGAALKVTRFSSAAVYVGRESGLGTERSLNIDTGTYNVVVGNGSLANTVNTLDVFGRIRATGTITANVASFSTLRYKTDVREFNTPVEILDITPKVFKYNNHLLYENWPDNYANSLPMYSEDQIGAIAEDFVAIGLDYLVFKDEQGRPESLDYSKIAILLIPYIKDLYNRLSELEEKRQQ